MKKLFAAVALAFLTACASLSPTSQLQAGFQTVDAYVEVTKNALVRGRISVDQAKTGVKNAEKARDQLVVARGVLANCKPAAPCTEFTNLLQAVQPSLNELELELRKQQGEVK
jgi:hypothetical protein